MADTDLPSLDDQREAAEWLDEENDRLVKQLGIAGTVVTPALFESCALHAVIELLFKDEQSQLAFQLVHLSKVNEKLRSALGQTLPTLEVVER